MQFDWIQALALVKDNAWLPLAIFVVGFFVRLLADDSRFPASVPKQWHAPIIIFLTWLYGFLGAWPDWKKGLELPMLAGLAILVLKAAFYGREPSWFRFLAGVKKPEEDKPTNDVVAEDPPKAA